MTYVVLTRKAKDDMLFIGRYTENKWGKNQRNIYLKMLDRAFFALAENPFLGRSCDSIKLGYKAYSTGKHIIFYTHENQKTIKIIRILHQKMDIEKYCL